jgi:hypothetical protein
MDIKRKKELLEDYKNRYPEMGVISYRCRETSEVFLGISKDTKSDFNSTNMKLAANWHPINNYRNSGTNMAQKALNYQLLKC